MIYSNQLTAYPHITKRNSKINNLIRRYFLETFFHCFSPNMTIMTFGRIIKIIGIWIECKQFN